MHQVSRGYRIKFVSRTIRPRVCDCMRLHMNEKTYSDIKVHYVQYCNGACNLANAAIDFTGDCGGGL